MDSIFVKLATTYNIPTQFRVPIHTVKDNFYILIPKLNHLNKTDRTLHCAIVSNTLVKTRQNVTHLPIIPIFMIYWS